MCECYNALKGSVSVSASVSGGCCVQDTELIAKSMDVIEGRADTVDITMTIHNAQRTFATTLSHVISM